MSGDAGGRAALHMKSAEIVVALVIFLLGAIVVFDSVRLGAKWGADGPQAGYFPFYLGVFICVSASINLLRALMVRKQDNAVFVERGQLLLVLKVLVPTAVYVALVGWIGIYVASVLFIGLFMRLLGNYAWWRAAVVSIGNSAVFYVLFEVWFKVPLPKGPLERLLGLD